MAGMDGGRDVLAVVDGAGRGDGLWWCVWSRFKLALEGFAEMVTMACPAVAGGGDGSVVLVARLGNVRVAVKD